MSPIIKFIQFARNFIRTKFKASRNRKNSPVIPSTHSCRLAVGGSYDYFTKEKPAVPQVSFPPFLHETAVGLCGYMIARRAAAAPVPSADLLL